MIKNTYFCAAQSIVKNPGGVFYIMLVGIDSLEKLFGILRTMVEIDSNVDLLQLVICLTRTTEVTNILSWHPEWDHGMCCLCLPAILQDLSPVPHNKDHLIPSSLKGDVSLQSVFLQMSWC